MKFDMGIFMKFDMSIFMKFYEYFSKKSVEKIPGRLKYDKNDGIVSLSLTVRL